MSKPRQRRIGTPAMEMLPVKHGAWRVPSYPQFTQPRHAPEIQTSLSTAIGLVLQEVLAGSNTYRVRDWNAPFSRLRSEMYRVPIGRRPEKRGIEKYSRGNPAPRGDVCPDVSGCPAIRHPQSKTGASARQGRRSTSAHHVPSRNDKTSALNVRSPTARL